MQQAVRVALEEGYRLIDTAACYENENEIGDVLQEFFTSGKLKREEVFITTKVRHGGGTRISSSGWEEIYYARPIPELCPLRRVPGYVTEWTRGITLPAGLDDASASGQNRERHPRITEASESRLHRPLPRSHAGGLQRSCRKALRTVPGRHERAGPVSHSGGHMAWP